jgi:hypothetical protein
MNTIGTMAGGQFFGSVDHLTIYNGGTLSSSMDKKDEGYSNGGIPTPNNYYLTIGEESMRYKKMFNVEFILPLNKVSYFREFIRGTTYNIFYANSDMSEVNVATKYKIGPEKDGDVCFVVNLVPNDDRYTSFRLLFNPTQKVVNQPNLCFEK